MVYNQNQEQIENQEVAERSVEKSATPVTLSDAKILLNSGKMGFIFIGVVVAFFVILFAMTFLTIPSYIYIIVGLLIGIGIYLYYLKMHENDEDKLD